MREHDHGYFKNFTRMTPTLFDELVGLLKLQIQKFPLSREPLSPAHRLAITLRFLASGDSLISIAYGFRIGKSTTHVVIKETCDALWDVLQPLYLKAPTEETWKNAAQEFGRLWQYPNCCGALDGMHVVIQQPPNSGSTYYNYKGTNSIVLMAVVDAEYKFLAVDIGGFGANSDGGIFKASPIGCALENKRLNIPPPSKLPRSNTCRWNDEPDNALFALHGTMARNSTEKAKRCRMIYTNYFWSEEGSVPWQWDMPGVIR